MGTLIKNGIVYGGGGASAVADLKDVELTSLENGQILKWDAENSKWINSTGGGDTPAGDYLPKENPITTGNTVELTETEDAQNSSVLGTSNTITDSYNINVIGYNNEITNVNDGTITGDSNKISTIAPSDIEDAEVPHINLNGSNIDGKGNVVKVAVDVTTAHINGIENTVNLSSSTAEFTNTDVSGYRNFIVGSCKNSHIEGNDNRLYNGTGETTHVEGYYNQLQGSAPSNSHVEGAQNYYSGGGLSNSHVEGYRNSLSGSGITNSHIEGKYNQIYGSSNDTLSIKGESNMLSLSGEAKQIAVEGYSNSLVSTYGYNIHVEGEYNFLTGNKHRIVHVEGQYQTVVGTGGEIAQGVHIEGAQNSIVGNMFSHHIEGQNNRITEFGGGYGSHYGGQGNTFNMYQNGEYKRGYSYGSRFGGYSNVLNSDSALYGCHLEGGYNTVNTSTALYGCEISGYRNKINAQSQPYGVHIEGAYNTANNLTLNGTHLEGYNNYVGQTAYGTHLEGCNNTLDTCAQTTHIEGQYNKIKRSYASHIEGQFNTSTTDYLYYSRISGSNNLIEDINIPESVNARHSAGLVNLEGYRNTIQHDATSNTRDYYGTTINGAYNKVKFDFADSKKQPLHIFGIYSKQNTSDDLLIVGNGYNTSYFESTAVRSNALELKASGELVVSKYSTFKDYEITNTVSSEPVIVYYSNLSFEIGDLIYLILQEVTEDGSNIITLATRKLKYTKNGIQEFFKEYDDTDGQYLIDCYKKPSTAAIVVNSNNPSFPDRTFKVQLKLI